MPPPRPAIFILLPRDAHVSPVNLNAVHLVNALLHRLRRVQVHHAHAPALSTAFVLNELYPGDFAARVLRTQLL
jgi:hypothetical protein